MKCNDNCEDSDSLRWLPPVKTVKIFSWTKFGSIWDTLGYTLWPSTSDFGSQVCTKGEVINAVEWCSKEFLDHHLTRQAIQHNAKNIVQRYGFLDSSVRRPV